VTSGRRSQRPAGALFAYDRRASAGRVAGADEAGRGCLAGPLVAAAVCLDPRRLTRAERLQLGDLDDSKRLTARNRERLAAAVWMAADQVVVVAASAATIDREGLHRTNCDLLAAALAELDPRPDVCLVDGFGLGPGAGRHTRVVGGDRTSAVIAAASVIAKSTRDRLMAAIAARYPGYGFDVHKGYATARHRDAIVQLGPSPEHRRSFASPAYAEFAARQTSGSVA
jgi:ribonuclease HII